MSDAFNGTTATFANNALGQGLRGVRHGTTCAKADVTGAEDSEKTHEPGIPDESVTIEFVGTTTVAAGDKGAIAITWDDATTESITNAACESVDYGGSMDTEITGTAVFFPSTAAAS